MLRMAEALNTKVVIPFNHDIRWSNFQADPQIRVLWEMIKRPPWSGFKPFIWQVGGKFTWPLDGKDDLEYPLPAWFSMIALRLNPICRSNPSSDSEAQSPDLASGDVIFILVISRYFKYHLFKINSYRNSS